MIETHGPDDPRTPLVLDSPHSGRSFPEDFRSILCRAELRGGAEDCFVDELMLPATDLGAWLLAARFPRSYCDANRHAGDIDLALIEGGAWPDEYRPSGLAAIGKSVVWRTLDDGRAIYDRMLSVDELRSRLAQCHVPYHAALARRIEATQARFGVCVHLNCHSMNAVGGLHTAGALGRPRPDFVVGDLDGSSAAPQLTCLVLETLAGLGYHVTLNDPFKGHELTRAYSCPAQGRHSLQLEVNKGLYMDEATLQKTAGFAPLQADLMKLVSAVQGFAQAQARC